MTSRQAAATVVIAQRASDKEGVTDHCRCRREKDAACVAVERAQSKDEICCKENLLRLLVPNDAREESGTVTHCLV